MTDPIFALVLHTCLALGSMAYWVSYALINYGFTFLMFSIMHRWLIASAWFLLGVVVGKASRR